MKVYHSVQPELGEQMAMVSAVEEADNTFYKSDEDESAMNNPTVLNITFTLATGATLWQNFVKPVNYGLFADLCLVAGIDLGEEGADIDPQTLVGLECIVEVVDNKKGFKSIFKAWAPKQSEGKADPVEAPVETPKKKASR